MSDHKTIRAKFQARFLPMIEPFMATNDIRFYLNGFLIERAERGGVHIVATNGHAMAIVYDAEGVLEGGDRIIVKRDVGLLRAAKARHPVAQCVLVENSRVIVAPDFDLIGTNLENYVMPGTPFIEANFPVWRKVLPDFSKLKPGIRSAAVNPTYMALFAKLDAGHLFPIIRFWQREDISHDGTADDGGSGIVVQHLAVPEFLGIVMACRDDERGRDAGMDALRNVKG